MVKFLDYCLQNKISNLGGEHPLRLSPRKVIYQFRYQIFMLPLVGMERIEKLQQVLFRQKSHEFWLKNRLTQTENKVQFRDNKTLLYYRDTTFLNKRIKAFIINTNKKSAQPSHQSAVANIDFSIIFRPAPYRRKENRVCAQHV